MAGRWGPAAATRRHDGGKRSCHPRKDRCICAGSPGRGRACRGRPRQERCVSHTPVTHNHHLCAALTPPPRSTEWSRCGCGGLWQPPPVCLTCPPRSTECGHGAAVVGCARPSGGCVPLHPGVLRPARCGGRGAGEGRETASVPRCQRSPASQGLCSGCSSVRVALLQVQASSRSSSK